MKREAAITIALGLTLSLTITGIGLFGFQITESGFRSSSVGHSSVFHEGNLTIVGNEVYLVDGGDFHQNGSVLVKDNATLIIRNTHYYQSAEDYEYISVMDQARFVIENSSLLFSYQSDVRISVLNQTMMNLTDSVVTNSLGGIWIWMGQQAVLSMRGSNISSYGDGGRVVADHSCRVDIQNSTLDFAVCWDRSLANISRSTIIKGAKAWSTAQVYLSQCTVDYLWAYQNCRIEIEHTTITSDAPFETALRASDASNVYFFSSVLGDDVNVAVSAKVRFRDSSARDVFAYGDSIVWLVNSTVESLYPQDRAKIYNFSTLQDAINKANEADCVLIPSGIYYENLVINKTFSLVGEDRETTYILGDGTSAVVLISADDVVFTGFSILNGQCGILASSADNCTINHNIVRGVTAAINLTESENCTVIFNAIESSNIGMCLQSANNSTVAWNTFKNNSLATQLTFSAANIFHHNSFVDNLDRVHMYDSLCNAFDDGVEGNYWEDYVGSDANHDGIGDSEQVLNSGINDSFPLLGPSLAFFVRQHTTSIVSNSTLMSFEYLESVSTIRLRVHNSTEEQSHGFCRVAIPYGLIVGNEISVLIDGGATSAINFNYSLMENSSHRWIYFAYEHSAHEIDIVPEGSLAWVLCTLITASVILLIGKRKKERYTRLVCSPRS